LRIAVNDELGSLERILANLAPCVRRGGRVAIISFHSLEDRIVKHGWRASADWQVLTKKPLGPSAAEVEANPRSRSRRRARQPEPVCGSSCVCRRRERQPPRSRANR
ncbi:MAG: 16S rRNA (cytosine(1402)-N(4))-methyltransferase, partial [bacterium]